MLRSLPVISRLLPATLITLITTIILIKSATRSSAPQPATCDGGQCDLKDPLVKPVSRQDLDSIQHTIQSLKDDIDALKVQPIPKELTPDEQLWESRRTECAEGVLRNIDYQHVVLPIN
jgi:hypothetical protein